MNARTSTLQDAFALHGQGRVGDAARIYQAIAAREPKNAEARHYLGAILSAAGRFDEAKALMKRSLELKPDDFVYLENYISLLTLAGDFAEALELSRKAIALQPRNPNVLYLHAVSLQKLSLLDEARENFATLRRLAPGHLPGRKEFAVTLARRGEIREAMQVTEALIAEQPRFADAYLVRANLHAIQGRLGLAVADYERALALQPAGHEARHGDGRALDTAGQYGNATAAYYRPIAPRPDQEGALIGRGNVLKQMGRLPEALASYDKAIALGGDSEANGWTARAGALAEAGEAKDAIEILRRVIGKGRRTGVAWLALADLVKFEPGDPSLAAMEAQLVTQEGRDHDEIVALHFALGKAYLDLDDTQNAFDHLDAGNRMKRAQLDCDVEAERADMTAIAAGFPEEIFARFAGAGAPVQSPIFIVGMPRSGTTLMEQILASHPAIHGAGELPYLPQIVGEIGGVAEAAGKLTAPDLPRLGEAYLARVGPLPEGKTRFVDKLPHNFLNVGLIRLILPAARIIHARRDPVDTCLSCYSKSFSGANVPYAYDLGELGRFHRAYQGLMAHWREVLPEDAMLEVDYEDVVADLEGQARRIVAYCGLEWDARCLEFHRTRRIVHTASLNQVRKPIYRGSVGRWRRHAARLEPLLRALGVQA
jgi:tetratricopeptide (TPR) repeat protein